LCVVVCPTGIDIRKGQQYECIGCGACIDACDPVMDKVGLPRGLIRYTTENALAKHWSPQEVVSHIARPRILLYTTILVAITVASAWSLATRVPLKVDVIRDRSLLSREANDGGIEIIGERVVAVDSAENQEVTIVVRVPPESGKKGANTIHFDIKALNHDKIAVREKASFLMP
jgi:polyferredoxin